MGVIRRPDARSIEVRLWLSVVAHNLGNLWRRLVLPKKIDHWSLASLQQRLVTTEGRLVKHARCHRLLLAESHLTRRLFGKGIEKPAENGQISGFRLRAKARKSRTTAPPPPALETPAPTLRQENLVTPPALDRFPRPGALRPRFLRRRRAPSCVTDAQASNGACGSGLWDLKLQAVGEPL